MAKLRITALDGEHQGEVLEAQFNPKEVAVEQATSWQRRADKEPGDLDFERAEPTLMSFELLFDGVQSASSVQPQLDVLRRFGSVDAILRRPPKVDVTWGSGADVMPKFAAVIESVTVRYAVFAESGVPLRATADVKLKQAARLGVRSS